METQLQQEVEPEEATTRDRTFANPQEGMQSSAFAGSVDLAHTIATSSELQRRYLRYSYAVPIGLSAAVLIAIIAGRLLSEPTDFLPLLTQPGILLMVIFGLLIVPLCAALALNSVASRLAAHTVDLAKSANGDAVGPLIDLLAVDQQTIRRIAGGALTTALPSLKDEDASILTNSRRQQLIKRLRMNPDYFLYKDVWDLLRPPKLDRAANTEVIDFRVAILESYANVGSALELPVVRQLAESRSEHSAQQRLRAAAIEALPAVEARAALQAQDNILLRAAQTSADPGTLLQPSGSPPAEPATLLRPAD